MRIILNITLPVNEFNIAVKDGSVGQKIGRIPFKKLNLKLYTFPSKTVSVGQLL